MKKIQVHVLQEPMVNPINMTNFAAKLTQHGAESIFDIHEFLDDVPKNSSLPGIIQRMNHPNVTRHSVWTVIVIGGSRRLLAQLRTHHVGIDWTSASLQYQDIRGKIDPVIPYEITAMDDEETLQAYKEYCRSSFLAYDSLIGVHGVPHDAAAYVLPQASRNVLMATGNTEAFSNLISQRSCNRNSPETQYVAMKIWLELLASDYGAYMFANAGPYCVNNRPCNQGKMQCKEGPPVPFNKKMNHESVTDMLHERFRFLHQEEY